MPYGGPIVEMDALIGEKCIRCLDFCQTQHPTSDSCSKVFTHQLGTRNEKHTFIHFIESATALV